MTISVRRHPAEPDYVLMDSEGDIAKRVCERAGCRGHVYINIETGEAMVCDASDIVLWRGSALK